MIKPSIAATLTTLSLVATGIGIAISQTSSKDIESTISSNRKQWKGKFDAIREKLVKDGISNIAKWDEEIFNKWVSRLHTFVPEEFKGSIVNEIWMPVMTETLGSKNKNILLRDVFFKLMKGKIEIGGSNYKKFIEEIKKDQESNFVSTTSSQNPKTKRNSLDEKTKEDISKSIKENYESGKTKFKKTRDEWMKLGKGSIPDWNDEIWKKSVAHFYINIPENEDENLTSTIDDLWEDVMHISLLEEKYNDKRGEIFEIMKKQKPVP